MGMLLNPCTLLFLGFSFDSPALEVSNRVIVMAPQTSTEASGKTAFIPDRASHPRGAGIRPGPTTLWVDPFPRLERAYDRRLAPFPRRMRRREPAVEFASIVRACTCTSCLIKTVLFVVTTMLGLGCLSARGFDFELSGGSTYETFKLDGTRAAAFSSRFTVQKSGQKWLIVNSPTGSPTTEAVIFDGIDGYTLTRNIPVGKTAVSQLPPQAVMYREGVAYARASTAVIFSGETPLGASAVPRLLWEAFLAERVLKAPRTVSTPAPWDAAYRPEASSFELNIQWPQPEAQYPSGITFLASNRLWENSTGQFGLTNISPYEDGFTAGTYRVTEWTNVDIGASKVPVPAQFELLRYFPTKYKASSPLAERVLGQVTSVVPGTRQILPLELDDEVNVLDYRFRDSAFPWLYVVYAVTNKTWKSTNDSLVRELIGPFRTNYIRAQSMRPYRPTAPSPREAERLVYVRFLLVLVLAIGPIAGLLVWKLQHKRVRRVAETS